MSDDPAPPDFDPDLWIMADGCEGRLYLLGNPHTSPGRISVWSEDLKVALSVSKDEITMESDAAGHWIDGYLSGNEPSPAEYLGIDKLAVADLDDDDPGWKRWQAALANFRETGMMPSLARVPTLPFSDDVSFDVVPWTWAGGQVWIWRDDAWVVADPQPALDGGTLAGSICASRGYHDMDGADERHIWCVDCGNTVEVYP